MKNKLFTMINSMNEEELTKIYQLADAMMQEKQNAGFFDETINYVKYRSLCSVPQDFWKMGIQSPSSQECMVKEYNETKEGSRAMMSTEKRAVSMEYNTLMEDEIPSETEDVNQMTVFGSDILRNDILSITILNSVKEIPVNHWDVSKEHNRSILAWVVEKKGGKELFLYSTRRIMASSCTGLFENYNNLKRIHFNRWFYTNEVTSMSRMFMNCKKLKTLNLSTFDTSKVTDMSLMFFACEELKTLNLSTFDTAKVTNMASMFFLCRTLIDLNVSAFDTAKVTNMNSMFMMCRELTDLNVSSFITSEVIDMDVMFAGCRELTDLNLTFFDFSKVKTMKAMFMHCSKLIEINVKPFNTARIETEDMFAGCDKLSEKTKNRFQ